MKWILALLLFVSAAASAQIGLRDDSTKYIHYKYQYGSRMPRFWADSALHMPYYDTAIVKPQKPGAIMMHTDKVVYKWNGGGWEQMSGGVAGLTNVGTGFRLVTTPNGSIKSIVAGDGLRGDSTANANSITFYRDTTGANGSVTRSELKDTTSSLRRKISDTLVFALRSILIPSRLEFIASADTATYQNDDLIGAQIMMLSIESYQVGFTTRSTSVYISSFDAVTGTITLTNGEFASGDQVIIIYRTPPVFLLDGSGNPVRDGSGNFIILN